MANKRPVDATYLASWRRLAGCSINYPLSIPVRSKGVAGFYFKLGRACIYPGYC